MAIENPGATYYPGLAERIEQVNVRMNPRIDTFVNSCIRRIAAATLAASDTTTGALIGVGLTIRSFVVWSKSDWENALWHFSNAAKRVCEGVRIIFGRNDTYNSLRESRLRAFQHALFQKFQETGMRGSQSFPDATKPATFTPLYPLQERNPTMYETLLTTRTHKRQGSPDLIYLLEEAPKVSERGEKIAVLASILRHPILLKGGLTREIKRGHEVILPSLAATGALDKQLQRLLPLEGDLDTAIEYVIQAAKDPIVASEKKRESTLPIYLLEDAEKAGSRDEKITALTCILTHETLLKGRLTREIKRGHEVILPSLAATGALDKQLQRLLPLEGDLDTAIEYVIQAAKDAIVEALKQKVFGDIHRSRIDSGIHSSIGSERYWNDESVETAEYMMERANAMWETILRGVEARMVGKSKLEIFRQAAFIFDHMDQTGFSLSFLPLFGGVLDPSRAGLHTDDENGFAKMLQREDVSARLHKRREENKIQLSDDMGTLTSELEYQFDISTLEESRDDRIRIPGFTIKGITTVNLDTNEAEFNWHITTAA